MQFSRTLLKGTLIKRYKRFLADITLENGETITAHCPNSGSMRGCSEPGSRVCLSVSDNPKRKYPHTLEMISNGKDWIGVNTSLTNGIVVEAIEQKKISELGDFDKITREIKTSDKSRLDILLSKEDAKTYIEVKNCSLAEGSIAMFPDAVTARGTKHLHELAELVRQGHRGVIFFLIQRNDVTSFTPAAHIDPVYATTLAEVIERGVEPLAYQAEVTPQQIYVRRKLPFFLNKEV
jgi:sugar fermentation stimulation protein A